MEILGIAAIIVLPYMAGYILKTLFNSRETGQSEIYLTGFFFVFLLQGVIFGTGYMFLELPFESLCKGFLFASGCICVLFVISVFVDILRSMRRQRKNEYRQKIKTNEWILLLFMLLIAALVVLRVFSLIDYIRDDYMLPTVKTILRTGTVNQYNPITGRPYVFGLITSRKIITLPVYYAYLSHTFSIRPVYLLYIVLTLQTVFCTYLSVMNFMVPILKQRNRIFVFGIFCGALILSGDYFVYSACSKILWRGYAGDSIVAAVMLPYVLSVIILDYRHVHVMDDDTSNRKKNVLGIRIISVLKIALVCAASVFITGVANGLLLILITIVMALICYYIAARKRLVIDEATSFIGE